MKQILHIFAKDTRHLWLESLSATVLIGTYAWITPSVWLSSGRSTLHAVAGGRFLSFPQEAQFLSMILGLLVPVSWWLLIARVVLAEALVGDRQFWLTRPYEWKKLLAAKLLFLVAFLYLPLFIAQCWLLFEAGYHPLSFVPGMLFNLLLMTGTIVLPLLAITTVTASFARLTVTLIAGMAIFVAYVSISLLLFENASIPGNFLSFPLCLLVCGIVVVLQYSARRVRLARLLLIGLPVLVVVAGLALPPSSPIDRDYARARPGQAAPMQLVPLEDPKHPATTIVTRTGKQVVLSIPVQESGVAAGHAILPDQVKVTVDAANGRHWASNWQPISNERYLPGASKSQVNVMLDRAFFEQVKSAPVTLHFTFALTLVREGEVRIVPLPTQYFSVPDFGICSPNVSADEHFTGIACRFALHQPKLTYISVVWPDSPCRALLTRPATQELGDDWVGNLESTPADFGISPVKTPEMGFTNNMKGEGEDAEPRHLCPGTPVSFTQYDVAQRMQYDLTLPDFRLPVYQQNDGASLGASSVGFDVH